MMVSDGADRHRQLLQVNELDLDDSTVVYDDEQCNENGDH